MAGPNLPVNIDTTYANNAEDDSVAAHQQHHDAVHAILNKFDTTVAATSGSFLRGDGTTLVNYDHEGAADPHTAYQKESEKAAANGYASLDDDTKVPYAQLPTGTEASTVAIGSHAHAAAQAAIIFSLSGAVSVGAGAMRLYNDSGSTMTITSTRAALGTAPTGDSIIIDLNINGTSIWDATQANRITVAATEHTGVGGTPDDATIASGEYVTCDVDNVGSTIAGTDCVVSMWVTL